MLQAVRFQCLRMFVPCCLSGIVDSGMRKERGYFMFSAESVAQNNLAEKVVSLFRNWEWRPLGDFDLGFFACKM